MSQQLLIPYHGMQYHLEEWGHAGTGYDMLYFWYYLYDNYRPGNKEELFNLHHSSLHNVIEWIFGVLK
jgi:hypothetical protein